jgi:quinolinate synthase
MNQLAEKLKRAGYLDEHIFVIQDLIEEINRLKKEKNATILAHSYQTPDIVYGVADHVGDSYGLSVAAKNSNADTIVFCGVRFMAETAKLLNPGKLVLLPAPLAGCTLAESITARDVIELKNKYPHAPVVAYINTTAEVKAESDICCTSSNALNVLNSCTEDEVIFIPDCLMGQNLQEKTLKKLHLWQGKCVVHETFDDKKVAFFRNKYPGIKILAHFECPPALTKLADLTGGTGDMIRFVKESNETCYMLITECGLHERMIAEHPQKKFIGMCALCPFMKMTNLQLIRQVLLDPKPAQIIDIEPSIANKARAAINKMLLIK